MKTQNLQQKWKLIEALDFSKLSKRIQSKHPEWNEDRLKITETSYRQFLFLALKYPEVSLVPTKDMDLLWHEHILDTKQYRKDCQELFGRYLDHCPSDEDSTETNGHDENFTVTLDLMGIEFPQSEKTIKILKTPALCDGGGGNCSTCDTDGNCSTVEEYQRALKFEYRGRCAGQCDSQ